MTSIQIERFVSEIRLKLASSEIFPRQGNTVHDVNEWMGKNRVVVSPDFSSYLQLFGGMGDGEMDAGMIRFLRLEEISDAVPVYSSVDAPEGYVDIVFADYLIGSHGYAIRFDRSNGIDAGVFIVGGDNPIRIARSFGEFLQKYLDDAST